MPDYNEPSGRGNKKSDKRRKTFDKYGKNTTRGSRHVDASSSFGQSPAPAPAQGNPANQNKSKAGKKVDFLASP
jgi:hypothetical protein